MYKPALVLILLIAAIILCIKWDYICSRLVVPDIVEWKRPFQKTPPIYGDGVITQYFRPNFNGLFRVGFCAEYGDPQEAEIEVLLREKDRAIEIFKESIPLKKFLKNRIYRFSFSPQWNSAGKIYCLNISAYQARPGTDLRLLFDPGPFFHVRTKGKLYFGKEELPGELSMVSECRVRASKSEFLPSWHSFLADKFFAVFYMAIILTGLIALALVKF